MAGSSAVEVGSAGAEFLGGGVCQGSVRQPDQLHQHPLGVNASLHQVRVAGVHAEALAGIAPGPEAFAFKGAHGLRLHRDEDYR